MTSSDQNGGGSRSSGQGTFPPGLLDEIRHALGIVRVIEEHVALKRAGRTLKGLCPFHSEKTPSFHVDEAKGFYHCFGCGAGGDAFRFVMQVESLTFPEAVRLLADKAGIRMPELRPATPADDLRERILAINAAAQELYLAELARGKGEAAEALDYLAARGIGRDVVDGMGIGYVPEGWRFLASKLAPRFQERELTASGLLVPSDQGREPYDRFRKRITFPIRAVSDRIVGFGGRILGDGEPKYLNSPETPVYTKGRHLFGLDRARAGMRRVGAAVVVEGYLDCIALHASGVDQAVAVLGTALTPEQARLLGRYTKNVVLAFDGDAAGQRATQRSIPVLLAEGFEVRVLVLGGGEDPDDHVRRVGGEAMQRELAQADSFMGFLVGLARREHDLGSPTGRVRALHDILPLVAAVEDPILRSEMTDAACHGLGVRPDLVKDEVRRLIKQARNPAAAAAKAADPSAAAAPAPVREPDFSLAEHQMLSWLLASARARRAARERLEAELLASLPLGGILKALVEIEEDDAAVLDIAGFVDGLEGAWERQLVGRIAATGGSGTIGQHEPLDPRAIEERVHALAEKLGACTRDAARRRKEELDRMMAAAAQTGDGDTVRRLMAEHFQLSKVIHG